ncbi:hypothetical protein BDB00DRAFT_835573, partial [Zychaea mexicana]|uniref:uncharacterized protein n=1 Tax=Zychaea mexicana TaxID=64656 RepID=UPI0022FE2A4D
RSPEVELPLGRRICFQVEAVRHMYSNAFLDCSFSVILLVHTVTIKIAAVAYLSLVAHIWHGT